MAQTSVGKRPVKKRSGSSRREKRIAANEIFTRPLRKTERADLQRLAGKSDAAIDYSDARSVRPETVVVGRFYRPVKKLVSLRVDADVLDWFRSQGSRYQTRMNLALRREMDMARRG